jgi:hypothetical protein
MKYTLTGILYIFISVALYFSTSIFDFTIEFSGLKKPPTTFTHENITNLHVKLSTLYIEKNTNASNTSETK